MAIIDRLHVWPEKDVEPEKVLEDIYALIKKGKIVTWEADGKNSFFHTGDQNQWAHVARLKPEIKKTDKNEKFLCLTIELLNSEKDPKQVRGVYLGRFSHTLIAHLEEKINRVSAL